MASLLKTTIVVMLLCTSAHRLSAQNEALKILPNGNVGIGTPDPKNTLEVNGTVKATNFIGNGALVSGIIVMWWGDINAVPATWALCNGQNNTPDLRDRFVVGAGRKYVPGDKGGQDSVAINESQMPLHVHAGSTIAAGGHQHFIEGTDAQGLSMRKRRIPGNTTVDMGWGGGHNSDPGDEQWRGTVNTDTQGNHTHSLITTPTGANAPHENRPPYFALAYIMKL